jgi:hypothetical protein
VRLKSSLSPVYAKPYGHRYCSSIYNQILGNCAKQLQLQLQNEDVIAVTIA